MNELEREQFKVGVLLDIGKFWADEWEREYKQRRTLERRVRKYVKGKRTKSLILGGKNDRRRNG